MLDLVGAPAHQRVGHERVLHVDEDADGGIDPRQRLHREDGVEERCAGAALGLGNLDRHDPQVEELVDELAGDVGLVVHLADVRADFAVREFVHTVAKQRFILVDTGQSTREFHLRHAIKHIGFWDLGFRIC